MSDATFGEDVKSASFKVTPYKPDGGMELQGLIMLLVALALTGALLGFVANYVSQWFYLILLFPIGIGVALGGIGKILVKKAQMRNPIICGLAGLLGGIFAMLVMHYASFTNFQASFVDLSEDQRMLVDMAPTELDGILATLPDPEVKESILGFVEAYRASQSFESFMQYEAKIGVSLKRSTGSGAGLNLGYIGSWIYWLVEIFLVAGVAFYILKTQAAEPFCKTCSQWKDSEPVGYFHAEKQQSKEAVESGRIAQWIGAKPALQGGDKHVFLTIFSCSGCKSVGQTDVKAEFIKINRKGETKNSDLAFMVYPGVAADTIRKVFASLAAET